MNDVSGLTYRPTLGSSGRAPIPPTWGGEIHLPNARDRVLGDYIYPALRTHESNLHQGQHTFVAGMHQGPPHPHRRCNTVLLVQARASQVRQPTSKGRCHPSDGWALLTDIDTHVTMNGLWTVESTLSKDPNEARRLIEARPRRDALSSVWHSLDPYMHLMRRKYTLV